MPDRELYMFFEGGREPFESIYKCSFCEWRFPPIYSTELPLLGNDFRRHPAALRFAEHARNAHPDIELRTPLLGQAVKLPGVGGDYIVMGLDAKEKTAELMTKHPQVHEAVE